MKHQGRWDFKHHTPPFSKVNEQTMSKYFRYRGNRKTYKLNNPGQPHLPGLMRYDDPGNMCYSATGKILLSGFNHILEKWALQEFADMYALLDNPEFKHLVDNPEGLLKAYFKEKGYLKKLDNPWDLAAIGYGYDAF